MKIKENLRRKALKRSGEHFRNLVEKADVAVLIDDREEKAILGTITDITERVGMEGALRQGESRYRELADSITDVFFAMDKNLRCTFWNRASEELTGIKAKDAIGKSLFEVFPDTPQTRKAQSVYLDVIRTRQSRSFVNEYKLGNKVSFFEISAYPTRDGISVFTKDVTERRRAEEELKKSEERFKLVFEHAPDAYYLNDLKGNFVDGNKMAEELTGYRREELIGKSFLKLRLLSLSQLPKAAALLAKNAMGKSTGPDEFLLKRKDDSKVPVEISTHPVKFEGKTLVLGIARDITGRKQAEKALVELERKLRLLAESMSDVVFVYDMNRRLQYVNPAVERFTGYSIEELYEHNFINYVHPEDQERVMKLWERLLQGKSYAGEEFRIVTKDGKTKWCSSSWGPLLNEKGDQVGIQGRELDITKRKLAEETLRKNENKYRALFERANDAVFLLNSEGKHEMVNQKAADMLGYDIEELIGLSYRDILAASEYEDVGSRMKAIMGGGSFSLYERMYRRKDGSEFPVEINLSTIQDEEGRLLYVQRIVREITERKRAENELKQTSDKLRQALESIIKVVASTVEQRDPYTAGHQKRVADLARAIAIEMALSEDRVESVFMAGVIHDIGKISIPAEILSRPNKLSMIEFSLIKDHAKVGYEILKDINFPWPIAQIVYQHHERRDGSGYPQGLSGEDILLEARILGVADTVEAMASHRPYRPAQGLTKALEEISKKSGILYDPEAVDACLRLFENKGFEFSEEMALAKVFKTS